MIEGTLVKLDSVTLGSAQSAIQFTNINQNYDDLVVVLSLRSNRTASNGENVRLTINGTSTGYAWRYIEGSSNATTASSAGTGSDTSFLVAYAPTDATTANTFGSIQVYIPNYRANTNKSISVDSVTENNSTSSGSAFQVLVAGLWSNTSAITSLSFAPQLGPNWVANSTATLYGVTRIPRGAKATGGVIYDDATHFYHVFTSSGVFDPSQTLTADVLVVAGGGGGGRRHAGGGGAGGVSWQTGRTIPSGARTVTIGAGGNGSPTSTSNGGPGSTGSNSVFDTITSNGGGGGGGFGTAALSGGSGGGGNIGSPPGVLGAGGTATQTGTGGATGYGNAGGTGIEASGYFGGGGGGAGAAGTAGNSSNTGGPGGNGLSSNTVSALLSITTATGIGEISSGIAYIAGGGGGSQFNVAGYGGNGGLGGGGRGVNPISLADNAINGTFATGGGGGARGTGDLNTGLNGGNGGSGVVIIRYAK